MSASAPKILGSAAVGGGAAVATEMLAKTGSEQTILSIAVGLVVFLGAWGLVRKSKVNL